MAKIIEVEFKGGRKGLYLNPQEFPFTVGDFTIVEADKGEDLGIVVNIGKVIDSKVKDEDYLKILRKPNKKNIAHLNENRQLEKKAFQDCQKRIENHGLDMKLVDVEYQFDHKKITFYFTSDKRVDFRALVRDLAGYYKTRIELRQIGVRDEAKRIGGLGVCGYPLCCTTFLRDFDPVITQYTKDQNLIVNPAKFTGACGRLMCCLKYERDVYMAIKQKFPRPGAKIKTKTGTGILKNIDPIKGIATIMYKNEKEEIIDLDLLQDLIGNKKIKYPQSIKKNRKDVKSEKDKKSR
ncbi:MAG: regulatory iron-sulfur-containing complex subunit RicT [bacterium]